MNILLLVILPIISLCLTFLVIVVAIIGGIAYGISHPIETSNAMQNVFIHGILSDIRLDESTVLSLHQPVSKIFNSAIKFVLLISLLGLSVRVIITLILNSKKNFEIVNLKKILFFHILHTILTLIPLLVLGTILLGQRWLMPIPNLINGFAVAISS